MTSRIGLLSDIHGCTYPVQQALALFAREGVEMILCPGDIAGYGESVAETVAMLRGSGCHIVSGNHERWFVERGEGERETLDFLAGLPAATCFHIEGKRLYLVHASPPASDVEGIRLLDENGEPIPSQLEAWREQLAGLPYDVLVVGHTHQMFAEWLGSILVINPGSTAFNHSCAILHLPSCHVEWHALGGEEVVTSWNWGLLYRTP